MRNCAGRRTLRILTHPAVETGKRVFIDHGAGVVIGATSDNGDDVTLYREGPLGPGDRPRHTPRGSLDAVDQEAVEGLEEIVWSYRVRADKS